MRLLLFLFKLCTLCCQRLCPVGLILFLFIGQQIAFAQSPAVRTYNARTFYEDNGLASNDVTTMAQSSSGVLWFGSYRGISTFDGIRWNIRAGSEKFPLYGRSELKALPGDSILQMSFSPKGPATFLLHYKDQITELASVPVNPWGASHPYLAIAANKEGNRLQLACHAEGAIWLMNLPGAETWQKVTVPAPLTTSDIIKLAYFQNTLLLLTKKGLYSLQSHTGQIKQLWPTHIGNNAILAVAPSKDEQSLYLLGNDWIGEWSKNRFTMLVDGLYPGQPNFTLDHYNNIVVTSDKTLLFNHSASIFSYNLKKKELEPVQLKDPFPSATPTDYLEDTEGNLWISTLRGVAQISSLKLSSLKILEELDEQEVSTIVSLDSSRVLLGNNFGLNILQNNTWLAKSRKASQPVYSVNRIMGAARISPAVLAIAGSGRGLGILEKPKAEASWFALPDGLHATAVIKWRNKIIVGTHKGKILAANNGSFENIVTLSRPIFIRNFYIDALDRLVMVTPQGIFRHDGVTTIHVQSESPQLNNLYSLVVWKDRTLMGCAIGLCELKEDKIELVSAIEDIPVNINRPVYTLMVDKRDQLWLGTDKGVFILNKTKLVNFNKQNGLAGQEINRSALVEMPDGRIWIGTDRGLTIYDPAYDQDQTIVPRLALTSLKAAEQPLSLEQSSAVDHSQTPLEFGFRAVSFTAPDALEFRYRLQGLEEEWNYSDNHLQNNVRYASLPSGKYQFQLQARLGKGDWSPLVSSPLVAVSPPFYFRWWFLGLLALGIGLIGYTTNAVVIQRTNEKRLHAAIDEKKLEIKESESKFQAIWESMDSGVLLVNPQGQISMANPSFCRMFRCTASAVLGQEISTILEHKRLTTAALKSWFANPGKQRFEIDTVVGGFPLHLLITFSALKKQSSEQLLIIGFKDISDKKETEMKNLRLNELLVRQNRDLVKKELELASFNQELLLRQNELQDALKILEERNYELDQFVYKTSHDLRAPIASSLGLLNIMRMEGPTQSWPGYIDMIVRSLQKQDSFIKAMLNFSKTARAIDNPELIEFEPLIEQCLSELQFLPGYDEIGKRVRVKAHASAFYSDKMKINIILSNILSNSIKYRDPAKSSRLDVGVDIQVDQAQITISDNGIGINKTYVKSIFDMFYRATERSDGSGLGLYIVKQTVERLGGTIEVSSEIGIGSSFKITIPNRMPIAVAKEFLAQDISPTPLSQS